VVLRRLTLLWKRFSPLEERLISEVRKVLLGEREGDEFILYRIDPPAEQLFYLRHHDGTPERLRGEIADVIGEGA
jgi:hypothetical protein